MATQTLRPAKVVPTTAAKVASAASALFAVTFFLTVASVNVPHNATGPELLDWWQQGANQTAGIASMFFAIAAAILFIVVVDYLRSLVAVRGGSGHLIQFAHSMGAAFTGTLLVSAALRGAIGHLVKVDKEPLPGLDVLRYATSLNYTLLGTVTMGVLAASMLAISTVVLKSQVLAKWVGVMGIVCALIIVVAVAVSMGGFAIPLALLWALGLAVAIWKEPTTV